MSPNPVLASDVRVDPTAIEKSLAQWWRANKDDGEHAVTRAALWNVVAHTSSSEHQAHASETLAKVSAAVPQRTIIIRSDPAAQPEIASWIGANCHLVGGGKQVCSEEISIIAGGDRIHRLPPLVNALLIPDMPVAFWWLGDLPNEHEGYVETILEAADRLIVACRSRSAQSSGREDDDSTRGSQLDAPGGVARGHGVDLRSAAHAKPAAEHPARPRDFGDNG